jgi:hypothetical protein
VLGVRDHGFATLTQYALLAAVAAVGASVTLGVSLLQRQHRAAWRTGREPRARPG